jgi:DNA-binding beta-propeller fold protein YncE
MWQTATIRQVHKLTGNTITLAGSSGIGNGDGFGSADGNELTARFYHPFGVTTDGTHLYITDSVNNTIRKLSTTGTGTCVVTTFAGAAGAPGTTDGIGTSARFRNPAGITSDGTYLYVADNVNSTIRKVEIATGAVTTLAGSPGDFGFNDTTGSAARFNRPYGVVWDDATKSLYVADTYNFSIRKIQ